MFKSTILILTLVLFVSAKSFTSGYLIIVGGGKTKALAQTYEKKLEQTMWYQSTHQEGLPTLLLSDTVTGLNKGFHIAVAGITEDKAYATFIQQLLLRNMKGVYIRSVTLNKAVKPIEYVNKQPIAEYLLSVMKREDMQINSAVKSCDTLIINNGPYCEGGNCDNVLFHKNGKVLLYYRSWGGDHGGQESNYYYKNGRLSHSMDIEDRAIYENGNPFGAVLGTDYDTSWVYYVDGSAVALRNYEGLFFKDDSLFNKRLKNEEEYLCTVLPFIESIQSKNSSYSSLDSVLYKE